MMTGDDEKLSQTFAALASSTRRAILARLAKGEATVNELAEPFNMSLPAISKHIKVLERAGLIKQGQKAQYRPCTIDASPLVEVANWTEQYRHIWEARFDQMDDYIKQLKARRIIMNDQTMSQDAVVVERTFDAPVEVIWQMWTQPEHFKKWYGPTGFTVPVAEMDVQVGGKHLFCMSSPDGKMKMWSTGEYLEIVQNERLVYTDIPADEHGNAVSPADMGMPEGYPTETTVIVQLEDVGGKTKMTMTHVGVPASSGAGGGWEQAFDKMAAHLQTL